jgi:hypothetical protein
VRTGTWSGRQADVDLVLFRSCCQTDAVARAAGGSRIVYRCFRMPRRSRIRGYQSSACPFVVSRSWKGWTPFAGGLARYGQASPMVRGAASSWRRHCGLLPMQYLCCRAAAAAACRALILGGLARCAGPRRGAIRHSTPAHSTRCRDLTGSSQPPLFIADGRVNGMAALLAS